MFGRHTLVDHRAHLHREKATEPGGFTGPILVSGNSPPA